MRRICISLILVFTICLGLSSCSRQAVRITRTEALPIQYIIDGINKNDPETYRKAFPPDYNSAIEGEEAIWKYEDSTVYSDYDSYLKPILALSKNTRLENYGKRNGIEYIVEDVKPIEFTDYPQYFEKYDDLYVYSYDIDPVEIQKAAMVKGKLNVWGSKKEETKTAEFVVICINGVWYLHPVYYYTSLS